MQVVLRSHQSGGLNEVALRLREGKKNVMISAPTGCGKTIMAVSVIQRAVAKLVRRQAEKTEKVLFVVDRISLIDQTSEAFDHYGIDHGVIQGDHPNTNPAATVQICSIQTIESRGWPDGTSLVLIDEAHTIYDTIRDFISPRKITAIGLTATPFTAGLEELYDDIVNVTTTNKLIEDGFLAPYRIFECKSPDMSAVKLVAGEFDENEAANVAIAIVDDVIEGYLARGEGRKFICSGVNTKHVEALQAAFEKAGIHVATYTFKDPHKERRKTVKEFKKRDSKIRGLITVTAASKGFDQPDVSCVIMARPLAKSLAEHIQLLGRGLRTCDGKTDCIVLDFSGNCERFWDEMEDFFQNGLKELGPQKGKKRKYKKRKCPRCSCLHGYHHKACPGCGYTYPEQDEAMIDIAAGVLAERGADIKAQWPGDFWAQLCAFARQKHPTDESRAKKLALALHRQIIGLWPDRPFESTPSADVVCDEVREEARSRIFEYATRNSSKPATPQQNTPSHL